MKKTLLMTFVLLLAIVPVFSGNVYAKSMGITEQMVRDSNAEFNEVLRDDNLTNIAGPRGKSLYAKTKIQGKYPQKAGMILTTKDNENSLAKVFKLGHAAIVYKKNVVVESVAKGVTEGDNNWNIVKKNVLAGNVKKTSDNVDKKVAKWCHKQIGKGYNFGFYNINTRKRFYCSHLVYAGFKDVAGINLNTSKYDTKDAKTGKKYHAIAPVELLGKTNINNGKVKIIYKKVK